MPYKCTGGDDDPVVATIQDLADTFETVEFCAVHLAEFMLSSAAKLVEQNPALIERVVPNIGELIGDALTEQDEHSDAAGDPARDEPGGALAEDQAPADEAHPGEV